MTAPSIDSIKILMAAYEKPEDERFVTYVTPVDTYEKFEDQFFALEYLKNSAMQHFAAVNIYDISEIVWYVE